MYVAGLGGLVVFDASKPDGTMRKVLDVEKLKLYTWQSRTSLLEGISNTYHYFKQKD